MPDKRLEITVTTKREITGPIKDLVLFAHYLKDKCVGALSDEEIIDAAYTFYDNQHGED